MNKPQIYRALIVDDEPVIRQMTIRALATEGFLCHTASDGAEAKQLLEDTKYDVVVTDLNMPNCNGHALVTDLVQLNERPIIVVLTGVLEPRLAKDLIARGVEQINFKPVDYAMFSATVQALVHRHRSHVPDDLLAAGDADAAAGELGLLVGHAMARDVHTAHPTSTIHDVAKQMSASGVRHLPVVNYKNEVVGIISQRDLFRHMGQFLSVGENFSRTPIGEYMSADPETVQPTTLLAAAAETMLSKRIGCLPVVEEDRQLVGILTRTDLMRHLVALHRTESQSGQDL